MTMQGLELILRDVHVPVAPSLWPPAPGWWLAAGAALLCTIVVLLWQRRRRSRRRAWQRLFDAARAAPSGSARVAAMSELLRRAARGVDSGADRLQGEDWLRFLDGGKTRDFSQGSGKVLLEGGFRRELDAAAVDAAEAVARRRFYELMGRRR